MAADARRGRSALRPCRGCLIGLALAVVSASGCRTAISPSFVPPPEPGIIEGRVFLRAAGAAGPGGDEPVQIVVYLNALDDGAAEAPPARVATVRHTEQSFWPETITVAKGQAVRFINEGGVYHRLFSSSETNAFDLGLLKPGESREVRLAGEGVVRVYCSLHPWENGAIFVAPTPRFVAVQPPSRYRIAEVPPGRYRVVTWGDALPSTSRVVSVSPGQAVTVQLPIEGGGDAP